MVAATAGILRRPSRRGFMSPLAVLELVRSVEDMVGSDARDEALREALIHRLPAPDEPVREDTAARLHRAVRRLWPEDADALLRRAGEEAGRYVLEHRLPDRGRQLLLRMPRSAAAWLFARRTQQQAWTFAGSGRFVIESAGQFSLLDNPLVRGETADRPICSYHSGLFERQFRVVVHPGIRCVETACLAKGDAACVFRLLTPAEDEAAGVSPGPGASPLTSPA
jgi:divinyl protochlorophyllide a 8-vinyl-reductase